LKGGNSRPERRRKPREGVPSKGSTHKKKMGKKVFGGEKKTCFALSKKEQGYRGIVFVVVG